MEDPTPTPEKPPAPVAPPTLTPMPNPTRTPMVEADKAKALKLGEARYKAGRDLYQQSLVAPDTHDANEIAEALRNADAAEPLLLDARDLLECADPADGSVPLLRNYVADMLRDCQARRANLLQRQSDR